MENAARSFFLILRYIENNIRSKRVCSSPGECTQANSIHFGEVLTNFSLVTCGSRNINCGMCVDRLNAIGYCKDCKFFIDGYCAECHKRIKSFRHHDVITFQGKKNNELKIENFAPKLFCEIIGHSDIEMTSFCSHCKVLVCLKCKENHDIEIHDVVLLVDFFKLIDIVLDIKSISKEIMIRLPQCDDTHDDIILFTAIVNWTDMIIKFQKDFRTDEFPPKFRHILDDIYQNTSVTAATSNSNIMTCKRAIEAMLLIKKDFEEMLYSSCQSLAPGCRRKNKHFPQNRSVQFETEQTDAICGERAAKCRRIDNLNRDLQQSNDPTSSNPNCEESYFCPITMEPQSYSSADLFGSGFNGYGTSHQKPIEQEVRALQADHVSEPMNLDSFRNIHSHA
ncbi:uncharacterized protein LOC127700978 [Mytilus californianus]|uniref:uncharacterized protein LOC127700978 n=1 Tax=Mytilus californianus TaxID=6549 RepID=UPI0022457169|nr:uncharacterized protein LOC127700978 [Mytilus californianus]